MRIPGVSNYSDFALSRDQLRMLGLVFGLLGLVEMGAAYFIAHSITTHEAEATTQAVAQAEECKTRIAGLGYTATIAGNKISAEMKGLDDAAYKLGLASEASLSCQGWKLTHFCMGEGCMATGGVQFTLEPEKVR